jgi:membrane protein YqaA with SNARE-associated domain
MERSRVLSSVLLQTAKSVRRGVAPHNAHGLRWLMSFGTLGLFAVSVIDSSIIPLPLPGSTDLLLILLVAHGANPFVAAVAAIAGSLLGGYITWSAGAKGGEPALQRYLPKRYAKRLFGWVEKNGTLAVTASALLPPPFPLMPFLLAAGAFGVSRRKFFLSFGTARVFRYALVAWLAEVYGRAMVRAFRHYLAGWSSTLMWVYLGLMVAAIGFGLWKFLQDKRSAALPSRAVAAE